MTFFAVLATLAAWWGTTRSDTHGALKMLQLLVFGALILVAEFVLMARSDAD